MRVIQFCVGLILFAFPRRWLESFFPSGKHRRFYFSGRVAIYRTALSLKETISRVVLPDYVCNVLCRAFVEAGIEITQYKTSELNEPDTNDIVRIIETCERPVLLCLAPIFGADGGERWVTKDGIRDWRKKNGVLLLFDACQDITRMRSSRLAQEINCIVVSSFNDKSFPGLMGSIAIGDIEDTNYSRPSTRECVRMLKLFLYRMAGSIHAHLRRAIRLRRSEGEQKTMYDHSFCADYPYDFGHSGATKLQVSIAAAGLLFRRHYIWRKKMYLRRNLVRPVKTPYWLTAPYLYAMDTSPMVMKAKRPYSVHADSKSSLRPNARALHFKGFEDGP